MQFKKIDRGTFLIIFGIVLIISLLVFNAIKRNRILDDNHVFLKAKIIEVVHNASKGTKGNRNIAKYVYIYEEKKYLNIVEIYQREITAGDCYEVKVATANPEINRINLDKTINCD